jgi:hypothetical protein
MLTLRVAFPLVTFAAPDLKQAAFLLFQFLYQISGHQTTLQSNSVVFTPLLHCFGSPETPKKKRKKRAEQSQTSSTTKWTSIHSV